MTYDDLRALSPDDDRAVNAELRSMLEPLLAADGFEGVQARMAMALAAPFMLWLQHEVRRAQARNVETTEIVEGASTGFAALITTLIGTFAKEGRESGFALSFLAMLGDDLATNMRGDPADFIVNGKVSLTGAGGCA